MKKEGMDVYITTEYTRNKKKPTFNMVAKNIMISGLALATLLGSFAPTQVSAQDIDAISGVAPTVTQSYQKSGGSIREVQRVVQNLKAQLKRGVLQQSDIDQLATELAALNREIGTKDVDDIKELHEIYNDSRAIVNNMKKLSEVNTTKAEAQITLLGSKLTQEIDAVSGKVPEMPVDAVTGANTKMPEVEVDAISRARTTTVAPSRGGAVKQVKSFSDVKASQWHYEAVMNLANRGGIAGYTDGTFKPNGTITFSEFLKMSLSSATGKEYSAQKGHHWASGVYAEAIKLGIIDGKEFPGVSETLNKPIIREDMTLILLNINIKIQGEANVDTSKTAAKIKDFDKVSANRKAHILQAYEKGLIVGKPGIGVDSKNTTTRAEAATVIMRVLDKEFRVDPTAPVETPVTGAREIKAGQGVAAPKVGDTFIKKDGTKVVLEENYGVLGGGQGVDIYSGYVGAKGTTFTAGQNGWETHMDAITGRTFLGQPYSVHPKTGEGHFRDEWLRMETAIKKEAIAKYGTNAPYDGFIYKDYVRFDAGAGWTFLAKGLSI